MTLAMLILVQVKGILFQFLGHEKFHDDTMSSSDAFSKRFLFWLFNDGSFIQVSYLEHGQKSQNGDSVIQGMKNFKYPSKPSSSVLCMKINAS